MTTRKHYYLFQYAPNSTRIGEGRTVQEACKEAFGVVYGPESSVKYKDMGTRNPKYLSAKAKQDLQGPGGWLDIQAL